MTEQTKTAQFTRGEERVYTWAEGILGKLDVHGVIEEVAEDWVGFRYHNEDDIRVFGNHPESVGTLDELKPVTR
jgi:hypothetical protein